MALTASVAFGAALAGAAGTVAYAASADSGEGGAAGWDWDAWKRKITGNYENRIRAFSHPLKVFQYFASITDKNTGDKLMTPMDFVVSLLPYLPQGSGIDMTSTTLRQRLSERCAQSLEFFKLADTDGDGLISYSEYLFFLTLLATPEHHFRVAFKVLDADRSGYVDREEFLRIIESNSSPAVLQQGKRQRSHTSLSKHKSGLVAHFFGKDGKGSLDFETFAAFLRQLQTEMLKIEFQCYDPDSNNTISAASFARSLVTYADPKSMPGYIDRIRKLSTRGRVSFDAFVAFNSMLSQMDDVYFAMSIYSEAGAARHRGGDFTRADLKRAVRVATGAELDDTVAEVLFFVFDTNGDGSLNEDEFVNVIKNRYSRGLDHARDIGFVRLMSRLIDCYNSAR